MFSFGREEVINVNESLIELMGGSNPGNLARGMSVDATKQKLVLTQ